MRRRRSVFKRISKSSAYDKTTLEGVIIYVNALDSWVNVELSDGTILYRIHFSQGVSMRLKRVEQGVTLVQTVGKRAKYTIVGASRRKIDSTAFASKGTCKWDDGSKYNDRQVWA